MKSFVYVTLIAIMVANGASAFAPKKLPDNTKKPSLKSSVAEPMPKETSTPVSTNQQRRASERKKWGVDNTNQEEYWFDARIHTLGNCGFTGAVHAALAPLSTKLIDDIAYSGVDIRKQVRFFSSDSIT